MRMTRPHVKLLFTRPTKCGWTNWNPGCGRRRANEKVVCVPPSAASRCRRDCPASTVLQPSVHRRSDRPLEPELICHSVEHQSLDGNERKRIRQCNDHSCEFFRFMDQRSEHLSAC